MFKAISVTKSALRVDQGWSSLLRVFLEVKALTKFRLGGQLAVLLSMLALSACATAIKSTVDVADSADFAGLNTYAWMTDQLTSELRAVESNLNPLHERRIRVAVEKELERKGYSEASRDEADFVLFVRLAVTDQQQDRQFYGGYGYSYYPSYRHYRGYRHHSGFGRYGPSVSGRTVTEGNLVVDIFDNRSKEAIWHGSASKRLAQADDAVELIDQAVAALLESLPDQRLVS
jgi:hypothetical protein